MRPEADHIAVTLPSNPKYLGILRGVVGQAADLLGFAEDEAQELMLAVNEGCANIIKHGYQMDPGKKIDATISILEDRLEVELRDYGVNQLDGEPLVEASTELRPGGQGLRIMRRVMDKVEYRHAEEGGTLLTMVKYRPERKS